MPQVLCAADTGVIASCSYRLLPASTPMHHSLKPTGTFPTTRVALPHSLMRQSAHHPKQTPASDNRLMNRGT